MTCVQVVIIVPTSCPDISESAAHKSYRAFRVDSKRDISREIPLLRCLYIDA
jgi:hypothetical protein